MHSLLSYLINPLPTCIILLIIAFIFKIQHASLLAKCFIGFSIIYFLLTSTSFLPNYLINQLENQYPAFNVDSLPINHDTILIMVLGAGFSIDEQLPVTTQLSVTTLGRLTEAYRIHKLLPTSKIVTSAGKVSQPRSQAEVVADAALELGVSPLDTLILAKALNTKQEANDFAERFRRVDYKLILVTDATHMPRAMFHFQNQGIQPIAAPTNHQIKKSYSFNYISFLPSSNSIRKMEKAIHEYVGLWVAKWDYN